MTNFNYDRDSHLRPVPERRQLHAPPVEPAHRSIRNRSELFHGYTSSEAMPSAKPLDQTDTDFDEPYAVSPSVFRAFGEFSQIMSDRFGKWLSSGPRSRTIEINSPGGAYEYLNEMTQPMSRTNMRFKARVSGVAGSAALLLALHCSQREMTNGSLLFLHQGFVAENASALGIERHRTQERRNVQTMSAATGIPQQRLIAMLKTGNEIYLTPTQALRDGFIHTIDKKSPETIRELSNLKRSNHIEQRSAALVARAKKYQIGVDRLPASNQWTQRPSYVVPSSMHDSLRYCEFYGPFGSLEDAEAKAEAIGSDVMVRHPSGQTVAEHVWEIERTRNTTATKLPPGFMRVQVWS